MHLTKKYMGVTAPIMLTPEGVSFKIKDFRVYFWDVNASRRESPSACRRRPPPSRILSKRWRDVYPQANMLPDGGFFSWFKKK